MTKKILAALIIIIGVTTFAETQTSTSSTTVPSNSTPLRISFWPKVWQWPKNVNVYGCSLGFPDSYDTGNVYVAGVDMALFRSSSNVKGLQMAGGNIGKNSSGVQLGIANMYENFNGVQMGIYDESKNSAGLQLGAVNKASTSKCLQIGVINMMDDGFIPVSPIINFPKSWIND